MLKEYLLRGHSFNARMNQLEDKVGTEYYFRVPTNYMRRCASLNDAGLREREAA